MARKRQAESRQAEGAKRRRRGPTAHDRAEEERLSSLLFSGAAAMVDELGAEAADLEQAAWASLEADAGDSGSGGDDSGVSKDSEGESDIEREAAAWHDTDEEETVVDVAGVKQRRKLRQTAEEEQLAGLAYEQRLRSLFANQQADASWARLPSQAGSDHEDDPQQQQGTAAAVLAKSGAAGVVRPGQVARGVVDVTRMADVKGAHGAVQAAHFHAALPLLLTGGTDKTLRLYQADGVDNTLVQSVFLSELPIRSALYAADGRHALAFGRRPFFYAYDLESGAVSRCAGVRGRSERSLEHAVASPDGSLLAVLAKDGTALLLGGESRQWVASLKMNGTVRAGAFSHDSRLLHTSGGDGEVYTWDLRTHRCLHRYEDEGCVASTAFAASGGGRLHACGSEAGVVNLYDAQAALRSSSPTPRARLMNLTTAATTLQFCPDGQLMAMASFHAKDSLRLVHTASGTVFSNWPTQRTPLGYVTDVSFSSGGGMLAVANARGKVLLYRLNWYPSI